MPVCQVLPAILSIPFVIQIVCSASLETDIYIPKTPLNKQNYDLKVLSEIWSQFREAASTQSDVKSLGSRAGREPHPRTAPFPRAGRMVLGPFH